MARGHLIARTFVELADPLVEGYDPLELLHHPAERCVEVLGMAGTGLVLADARGQLQAPASSSERTHLDERLEVQHEDGPCLDCWCSGEAAAEDHLADTDQVLAQAMADVATIGILHERSIARREGSPGSSRWRSTPGWSSSRPKASSPRRRGPIWTKPSRSWAAMPGITTSCSPRWHDR